MVKGKAVWKQETGQDPYKLAQELEVPVFVREVLCPDRKAALPDLPGITDVQVPP